MRQDAIQRAQQMQQRVPHRKVPKASASPSDPIDAYLPLRAEETAHPEERQTSPPPPATRPFSILPTGLTSGLDHLLGQMDTDRMLILALLVMLYKDGSDRKLMMALAYLLT